MRKVVLFSFGYGYDRREITLREVIFSIIIALVMATIGIFINNAITNSRDSKNIQYYQALQIDGSSDQFQWGMRTNIGNAFVYGNWEAVGSVSYEEIDGEYSSIKKEKEVYTRHTRQVAHTGRRADGSTYTYYTTEEYWSWDHAGSVEKNVEKIKFLDVEFPYEKITLFNSHYITTIYTNGWTRYNYYGKNLSAVGTIYTTLEDNTIKSTVLEEDTSIEKALESKISDGVVWSVLFIVGWVILTIGVIIGFYLIDNKWLED